VADAGRERKAARFELCASSSAKAIRVVEQLQAEGCAKIYREKQSGARADRRELLKLLKAIKHGDVVTVTRIDRHRPLDI
jgi:DNA invertase Pin-like site-specific DNA recombinase